MEEKRKLKIGIIGAGISGSSSAYFLKDLFDDEVDLYVFEKSDKLGGRLATEEFNGRQYETGGSIIHSKNLYMLKFLQLFNLDKSEKLPPSKVHLALFNSSGIFYQTTGSMFGLSDIISFIKRYGFYELFRFKAWLNRFINDFCKIYKLQDHGYTFLNLEQFLNKLNSKMYKISQISIKEALKNENFNDKLINEICSIACLTNYGQTTDIDGFVGSVSLAGFGHDLWCVKNGNKTIVEKLLEKSKANIKFNTHVKALFKSSESKNSILYANENGEEVLESDYDYLLICFPIYKNVIGENFQLKFENIDKFNNLEMQLTNTYLINAEGLTLFNNTYPESKVSQLLSIDPDTPFKCISQILPCDFSEKKDQNLITKGPKIYKIFSEKNLDDSVFSKIFKQGYKLVKMIPWLAYPKYNIKPNSKNIPDIVLDSEQRSRVFYLNSLEWSSSCMEISCISARNVVNLIAKKENKKIKKIFAKNQTTKDLNLLNKTSMLITNGILFAFILSVYFKI